MFDDLFSVRLGIFFEWLLCDLVKSCEVKKQKRGWPCSCHIFQVFIRVIAFKVILVFSWHPYEHMYIFNFIRNAFFSEWEISENVVAELFWPSIYYFFIIKQRNGCTEIVFLLKCKVMLFQFQEKNSSMRWNNSSRRLSTEISSYSSTPRQEHSIIIIFK